MIHALNEASPANQFKLRTSPSSMASPHLTSPACSTTSLGAPSPTASPRPTVSACSSQRASATSTPPTLGCRWFHLYLRDFFCFIPQTKFGALRTRCHSPLHLPSSPPSSLRPPSSPPSPPSTARSTSPPTNASSTSRRGVGRGAAVFIPV